MSFAGHVLDMISRMKQNQALKTNRRSRYNKVKEAYLNELGGFNDKNNLTKLNLSKEELLAIKNRIKARLKAERKRSLILTIVFVFLACFIFAFLVSIYLKPN